ncbi:hypothetical protein [Ensifer sp. ENS02]|uniref:hypothetical protein n=1 Tax=Ensifer sp. ENS02 TaxID=2769290 RepID=UPI001FED81F0|nr:hypothetical protein [Ensifer sp. ENS02]
MFTFKRLPLSFLMISAGFSGFVPIDAKAATVRRGRVLSVGMRWPDAPIEGDVLLLSIGIKHSDGRVVYYSFQHKANLDIRLPNAS